MASHKGRKHTECVDCGKPSTAETPLSARGLHEACAHKRMMKSAAQMRAKKGPYYEQWRRSVVELARRIAQEPAN